MLLLVRSISSFAFVVASVTSVPIDGFTEITVPAFLTVLTVTLPVVLESVVLPPALNWYKLFVIVTLPVDGFVVVSPVVVIPIPSKTESTKAPTPATSIPTCSLPDTATVTPVPVKFQEAVSLVNVVPLVVVAISVGVGPGSDQVPSPLKKVSDEGVPVADRLAVRVPEVVMGPPVSDINVELAPVTDVTVLLFSEARIVLTTSETLKLRVAFSSLLSVPIKKSLRARVS